VMEEGVALRRGSLVLAPSEEKSTVVLVPPLRYQFYTNSSLGCVRSNEPRRISGQNHHVRKLEITVAVAAG
jgi:hypothetical protein